MCEKVTGHPLYPVEEFDDSPLANGRVTEAHFEKQITSKEAYARYDQERKRCIAIVALIRESNFDLRPFLADAFSKRMSRNLCDEFAAYELGLWLSKLEKLLRSQSGRDRLSKSLPGVEKAEKGSGANRSREAQHPT